MRIPAAYCGVVALKPTYGLVSMRGILSSSRSFDTCGPMARDVEDVALLFDAIGPGNSLIQVSGVASTPEGSAIPLQFAPASVTVR